MRNLGADALDLTKESPHRYDTDGFTKVIENLMYNDQGEHTTEGLKQMGDAIVDRAKEIVTIPAMPSTTGRCLQVWTWLALLCLRFELPVRNQCGWCRQGS